jgi:hypothetical protein
MKKLTASLSIVLLLIACSKEEKAPENTCPALTTVTSSVSAATVQKGQAISFQATNVTGITYQWTIPGSTSVTTSSGNIASADFTNKGWYYLVISNNCNQSRKDSFYVDVTMPQGTAACSPTNNTITFSENGSNGTLTSIVQGESGIPNEYRMYAWGGGNDFSLIFHPSYKNNNQPKDGIYTTGTFNGNSPSFGTTDIDKVFIVNITYSPLQVFYKSIPNQKIYVSRVNGKMRVTICSLGLTGTTGGTTYTPTINAMITEQ